MSQLPLPLSFDKRFSLHNYIADNADYLRRNLTALFDETGEALIGLCGSTDSGKTHLLNACAHYARDCRIPFHLYDAAQLMESSVTRLSEMQPGSVLGVDNLELLAGNRGWEEQFYQLINQVKSGHLRCIFTLSRMPRDIGFRLPDLKSRLGWGLLIALQSANDEQLENILSQRARLLGMELPQEALNYLVTHFSRRLRDQMQLLYLLERESLSRQRKITIPFIREVCQPNSVV